MDSFKKYDNYDHEKKRFKNLPGFGPTNPTLAKGFGAFLQSLKGVERRTPEFRLPDMKPCFSSFLEGSFKFIWFGHSSIYLQCAGKKILLDPVLESSASPVSFICPRFQEAVCRAQDLPVPDFIVLSHNHHDHYDPKVLSFFADKKVHFIVPKELNHYLYRLGIPPEKITDLNWGESISESGVTFYCTPARHASGMGLFDQNKSLWASWVISIGEKKIFFSGDGGYGEHFKEIGEIFGPFDLAFVENGQYNERWPHAHLFPEETVQVVKDLSAKYFVPIHWAVFALSYHPWDESVKRSFELSQNEDFRMLTPLMGQVVSFDLEQGFGPERNNSFWVEKLV